MATQAETVRQELAQLHQRARRVGVDEAELHALQASSDEMQVRRFSSLGLVAK